MASGASTTLEWDRFLSLVEKEARTEPGKRSILALTQAESWAQDLATARSRQQETQEILPLLDRDGLWGPLTELRDPEECLERLARGSVLELAELVNLRSWIYALDSWSQVPREEIKGERFKKALISLPDPFQPLRIVERVLTPEGEMSEKASPRLASLYSEIRSLKRDIGNVLDQLVKTFSQKGILQENFSDVRDGRYVIPVKISSQNEIDGIVYEASASRQTVFVEPKEVSPLNNRLRKLQNDLIQEIFRVLEDTSKQLLPFAGELSAGAHTLSYWDAVQARARISRHYGGKPINVTEERDFLLHSTAHPLLFWSLDHEKIIRNEMDFGDPVRTLLLTGPNTGGKTVLLKTLGMAGICARTGFPFPGTDHPTVPFFDSFYADMGDPQSIEQHLSSFSGHIMKFREILEHMTERSLVLLDELNTATDPEEGAALGRAFLETVMARGAIVVATTHDPQLKALAISDERILNASMAFDESSRTPTYRVVLGVPGRSRALETAERLGMPQEVMTLARRYLSKEHLEFEGLLARLENDANEAEKAKKDAIRIRDEAERLKKEWTERTQSNVGEVLERTRQKLRRILEQAQDEVRTSVKKLDEMKSRKEIDQTRGGLNQTFTVAAQRIETALSEESPDLAETLAKHAPVVEKAEAETGKIEVGTPVRIPKWKSTGKILEIHGLKVKVSMGSIQMQLSVNDVEPLTSAEAAGFAAQNKPKTVKYHITDVDRPAAPAQQIDIRGTRLDEAMSNLQAYLDQAFRSGAWNEVTIVHGLGTGALREGARKMLNALPYVKSVRDGGPGHGGAGATIVEFEPA